MSRLTIREERDGDAGPIRALTRAAFEKASRSDGNEHLVVDALRTDGDLTLSLVATNMDEAIVGHVAFSPITISDGTTGWYAAGPVSVIPTRQRTGIGSEMFEEGIERMITLGARGIVLLGDPAYYARFGFLPDPGLILPGVPPALFQARNLSDGPLPKGEVTYAPAFGVEDVAKD